MKNIITILDNITETSMPFNEFVLYRANHFKDENHILIVCNAKKELPQVSIPSNLKIIYIGKNILKIRKLLKKIIEEINKKNEKYLIHIHQLKSGFLSNVSMIGTGFRKKVIYTIHSTFSGYSFHNKFLSLVNAIFAKEIICVSNVSFNDYPKFIKSIKKNRICAIQNGVDTERIDLKLSKLKSFKDNNIVKFIYVARIIPIKNHEFLIDVLRKTSDNVKFIFVGNGSNSKNIEELIIKYDLKNKIQFTGLIPREKVFEEIYNSDVYISSSTLEGMPVSVLEAAYIGLPIILSNIPQHEELAKGNDYISILPFDCDKWALEINKYASMSQAEREKLGKLCSEFVLNNFSLKRMHSDYQKIYEKLYEEKI